MEKKNDTRDKLLRAAAAVFREKGYDKAKVSDIVALAEVAQGTFYVHFKTKNDCLNELLLELMGLFLKDIRSESENIDSHTIYRIINKVMATMRKYKDAMAIVHFEQSNISDEVWQKHKDMLNLAMKLTEDALIVRGNTPEQAASKLLFIDAVFSQFLLNEIFLAKDKGIYDEIDSEEMFRKVIEGVCV